MDTIFNYLIKPKDKRYENTKKVGDSELILNTEMQDHNYVSRRGVVLSVPVFSNEEIEVGDEVVVHHNVFRRFYDVRGREKNSASFYKEDQYFVYIDQIFMFRKQGQPWKPLKGYCFVQPVKNDAVFSFDPEKPNVGIMAYTNDDLRSDGVENGCVVGFKPDSEYEFIIDDKKMYRVLTNSICILYGDEHKGKEEEYNYSWL